jgi:hypothetical protein
MGYMLLRIDERSSKHANRIQLCIDYRLYTKVESYIRKAVGVDSCPAPSYINAPVRIGLIPNTRLKNDQLTDARDKC